MKDTRRFTRAAYGLPEEKPKPVDPPAVPVITLTADEVQILTNTLATLPLEVVVRRYGIPIHVITEPGRPQ